MNELAGEGRAVDPQDISAMVDEIIAMRGPGNSLRSFAQEALNRYRAVVSNADWDADEDFLRRAEALGLDIYARQDE